MPEPDQWTDEFIPAQDGKPALVTGANSGLARVGATVIMTARSLEKGEAAAVRVGDENPNVDFLMHPNDLQASLSALRPSNGMRVALESS